LPGTWPRLLNQGVIFGRSDQVRGLQVVDIIAHALFRRNKHACPAPDKPPVTRSRTDELAAKYIETLEAGGVLIPLMDATNSLFGPPGLAR
jgi:hypothetical protein